MRHPKRTITRALRTRRPIHPGRESDELEAMTWPESLRVADCMTRGAATIRADALARGAADMMRTRRIRHLPVVDGERGLVGIITDRDLRHVLFDPVLQARARPKRAAHVPPAWIASVPVRRWMRQPVITIDAGTPVREAVALMMFDVAMGRVDEDTARLGELRVREVMTWGVKRAGKYVVVSPGGPRPSDGAPRHDREGTA